MGWHDFHANTEVNANQLSTELSAAGISVAGLRYDGARRVGLLLNDDSAVAAAQETVGAHDGAAANHQEKLASLQQEATAADARQDIAALKQKRRDGLPLSAEERDRIFDYLIQRL